MSTKEKIIQLIIFKISKKRFLISSIKLNLLIQDGNEGLLLFENSIDLIINDGFNGIIKYS